MADAEGSADRSKGFRIRKNDDISYNLMEEETTFDMLPHGKVPHIGYKFGYLDRTEDNTDYQSALARSWYTGVSRRRLVGLIGMGCPVGRSHCKMCRRRPKGTHKQKSIYLTFLAQDGQ